MEIVFSILLGLGLAVACGFKVFVPFLIISIASLSGNLKLAGGFEWIATYPALITFGVATLLEILTHYLPFIDNLLDVLSTPVAIISGTIIMLSCVQGMSPLMTWVLAVIVGGTVTGGTKVLTSVTRVTSTVVTGGSGNFILNTIEVIMSFVMSIVAIMLPFLVIIFIVIMVIMVNKIRKKIKLKRSKTLTD